MAQNESFDLLGPAGRLEALLMHPEGPPEASAIVCHAHPLHGGIMHFKAVFRAAKALQEGGLAVLRFNFRGVGRSEGVHDNGEGEQGDAIAAMDEMKRRFADKPLVLGGFSFGAMVALRVGARDARAGALMALGYPFRMETDTGFLRAVTTPRLFVQGEHDQFGGGDQILALAATLPEPKRVVVIPGADHFFNGQLEALQQTIAEWVLERPWERT